MGASRLAVPLLLLVSPLPLLGQAAARTDSLDAEALYPLALPLERLATLP